MRPTRELVEYFIVEIQRGVWIAPWDGDPGRTLKKTNARKFISRAGAFSALRAARKYRPFRDAMIHRNTLEVTK